MEESMNENTTIEIDTMRRATTEAAGELFRLRTALEALDGEAVGRTGSLVRAARESAAAIGSSLVLAAGSIESLAAAHELPVMPEIND
jgi:hypothetical protein